MFDFELYLDDSGTHEGSPVAVAACYLASQGHWKAFVRSWNKVLKRERLDAFHMTDFMAKPQREVQPYCNWSKRKKDRVYEELASIINKHIFQGFAFAVPTEAYKEHASERFRKEVASDAFTFAVQCVLGLVRDWHSKFEGQKAIQFVFEDRRGKGQIMEILKVLEENRALAEGIGFRPDIPGGVSFQSARFFKPLQSADVLAWNMRNHMENVVLKGLRDEPPNIHPYFDKLRLNRPVRLSFLWDHQVKGSFENMKDYEKAKGERAYRLPRKTLKRLGPLPTEEG